MSASTATEASLDPDALEAQQHEGIKRWIRDELGGDVSAIERLERWRPQWKVTYEKDGRSQHIFVRGNRPVSGQHALRFEMEVMAALEANGIKVPHIYGWMDSPKAFVMDWIDTEDRAPGMLHTAIENPSTMSDERWMAMLHYMEELAKIHAVPLDAFSHIRGLSVPDSPAEIALTATERMYRYGEKVGDIDATFAFLQVWLRRNVPAHRTEPRFITGDAGQFMAAGTEVAGIIDLEIATIGDTHWDLACFRGRHPYENMGDIPALYRRYGEATGVPVDLRVVGYHTVNFLQLSAIAAKAFMHPETQGANWIEGVLEYASITRRAFEAIAELQEIPLDHDLRLPESKTQSWEDSGLRKLIVDIGRLPTSTAFEPWERDLLGDIPRFLLNYSRYRDWFETEAVNDLRDLGDRTTADLPAADAVLSELIAADDPAHDALLVRLLHRRSLRLSMIAAGTDPDPANPLFHRLDPILS
ncbi:MAG: phosphotransferase [Myxococcota bacterium]